MVGIELVRDRKTRQPYSPQERTGHRVILEARRQGLVIRPLGDVIVLMPILSMSLDELEQVLTITYDAIERVTEGGATYAE